MKRQLQRLARAFGCDHNPLRRRVDRIESATMTLLAVAFLALAPFASLVAMGQVHANGLRELAAEQGWRPATATLAENARDGVIQSSGGTSVALVAARWRAPDGALRTGEVTTSLNAKAGQHVRIWLTSAGALTHPPLTKAELGQRATITALLTTSGVAVLVVITAGFVRLAANRRRMAGWDSAWAAAGPRWSKRP